MVSSAASITLFVRQSSVRRMPTVRAMFNMMSMVSSFIGG